VTHIWNKSLGREIEELLVGCANQGKGCTWVGEKSALANHLQSDSGCAYEEVVCSFGRCKMKMERSSYKVHVEQKCWYRPYTCEYCGHKDTYKAIVVGENSTSHYQECSHFPVSCPNTCGTTGIIPKDLKLHYQQCPLERVPCPYVETGCVERSILRKDLARHLTESAEQHAMTLLRSHCDLKEKYGKLAEKYLKLNKSLRAAHTNLEDLESRVEDLEY
jgi:hypothetical protein